MIEIVYLSRDNPNLIEIKQDGELIDFSAITRMVVNFNGSSVIADSDSDPTLFDWSKGDGVVEFNFNNLVVEPGQYTATLITFDSLHTSGQVLLHHDCKLLEFKFKADIDGGM